MDPKKLFEEKDMGFLQKLKFNFKAQRQFVKLFNTLCPECQHKVRMDPKTKIEDYCPKCQNKARYRIEKVKEMLK